MAAGDKNASAKVGHAGVSHGGINRADDLGFAVTALAKLGAKLGAGELVRGHC